MKFINCLKKAIYNYVDYRYYSYNVRYSKRFIKSISKNFPKLTRKQKSEVRKVYKKYSIKPDYRHIAFFTSAHGFSPYYISDNIYFGKILKTINSDKRRFMDDKNYYDLLFNDSIMPDTLFRKVKGVYLSKEYLPISEEECLKILSGNEDAIFKVSVDSSCGNQIIFKKTSSKQEMLHYMKTNEDFIVQKVIKQHSSLAKLNPGSINTFRILVFHLDESYVIPSSLIRCGITNSGIDNFSKGGITFAINEDGSTGEYAYDKYGKKYLAHPNGLVIKDFSLDYRLVKNVFDQALRNASKIPFMKISSWDYTIDEKGSPILIECNIWMGGQLDLHQMVRGPIFKDYFPIFFTNK